ncbi:MAG TPA: ORF6N domain-containing protein [Planctomycetota bacterium]|nr:ORF6N domain-containing protein [Planctomycetota bacterium]
MSSRSRGMKHALATIPREQLDRRILWMRGQKVMLDADLAEIYGVQTKALNQAVKRNAERFPADFMFALSAKEKFEVVTNYDHLKKLRFSPTRPYAFTEHGAIMAATVLNSPIAMQASVFVVRAFVKLRELLLTHKELARKLQELEWRLDGHDQDVRGLVVAIRELAEPLRERKRARIGFRRGKVGA